MSYTVFDPHKFSTNEIFSNNNGKTSSTKVVGFIASIVCLALFILLVVYYLINPSECLNILSLIDRTTTYFTVSAGLMGVKSITSAFGKNTMEIDNRPTKQHKKEKKEKNSETNTEGIEETI